MKKILLVWMMIGGSVLAENIAVEKQVELERYLTLSMAEQSFKIGLEEGLKVGFDPENNPGLAMIPPEKLARIQKAIGVMMNERFTFEVVKKEYIAYLDESFTLEELKSINALLEKPEMQKMMEVNINSAPIMIEASTKFTQKMQPEIMRTVQEIMMEP